MGNTRLLRILLVALPVVAGAWGLRPAAVRPMRRFIDADGFATSLRHGGSAGDFGSISCGLPEAGLSAIIDTLAPDKKDLRCFSISFHLPYYDKQGRVVFDQGVIAPGSYRVFLCKDLVMYEFPYVYVSGRDGMDPDTTETRYSYFVFHRDSIRGVEYDLHFPGKVKHPYVNSVRLLAPGFNPDGSLEYLNHVQRPAISRVCDTVNGNLTEAFLIRDSANGGNNDTLWLSFSDRYGVLPANALMMHDRDGLPNMRMVRLYLRWSCAGLPAVNGIVLDHAEVLWKVEETPFFNRDSAMIFLNKYLAHCDSSRVARVGQTSR